MVRWWPAALLPVDANPNDPFVMALRRIEFESSRLLQAQLPLLKGENLAPFRNAVSATLKTVTQGSASCGTEALANIGITTFSRNDGNS